MTLELVGNTESEVSQSAAAKVLSADEWAAQHFAQVNLGDKRLNRRAIEVAAKMAAHPEASLPNQMESRSALRGAYGVLNNGKVTMEALLAPHLQQTLAAAGLVPVVLMVEDTSELDYTAHRSKTGLGPIGDGRGRGLLLHSTLAIIPNPSPHQALDQRQILGLAHVQVVLRQPTPSPRPHPVRSPEAQLWEESATKVGAAPAGITWVHVSDSASDIFEYMAECVDHDKDFLVRAHRNRLLRWEAGSPEAQDETARYLLDYARSLSAQPGAGYAVQVDATKDQPARQAQVELQWAQVTIPPPTQASPEMRKHAPIRAWLLRVWESDPPTGVEPVEWILVTSVPITTVAEAYRTVDWYACRWLSEDYHQCLKTGCHIEDSQLDDGADIQRLLGFATPIAVRLLQLRQVARQTPDLSATAVVEPLMVEVLVRRRKVEVQAMTIAEFWQRVARLGGHQGRRRDGPPGWRTIWKGWRYLSDMTEGARLFAKANTS